MKKLSWLLLILILNTLDLAVRIFIIQKDWFLEENPAMAGAYFISPTVFVIIKTFLVFVGSILLLYGMTVQSRLQRFARAALPLLCFVYAGVVISHIIRFLIVMVEK